MPTRARRVRAELAAALAGAEGLDEVIRVADGVLRAAVCPIGGGSWSTVDPVTGLGTTCRLWVDTGEGQMPFPNDPERERRIFELEWADTDPNTFLAMGREKRDVASLVLDTGDPMTASRFREVEASLGAVDELRMIGRVDDVPWVEVSLLAVGGPVFTRDDRSVAAACIPLVGDAVRRAVLTAACSDDRLSDPPGVVTLDDTGTILTTSAAAEHLLSGLPEPEAGSALRAVTVACLANGPATMSVAGGVGMLRLHASPTKGGEGVSVVVERPRRYELASVIMDALGLTARERDVVGLLVSGRSRTQIARALEMAEATVATHLEHVYRKAGVPGRAELTALLFGSFFEPRRVRGAQPGPYGFFLE
jgi:DNA-binding CsgD family transcriptional regulator